MKGEGKVPELECFLPFLSPPSVILLNGVNFDDYLQEVQRGQKDLEDPLHHGDQQDQKGRDCQQAQVHPKNGNNRRNDWELALNHRTAHPLLPLQLLGNFFSIPYLVYYHTNLRLTF